MWALGPTRDWRQASRVWDLKGLSRGRGRVSALTVPRADSPSWGRWRGILGQAQKGRGRDIEGRNPCQRLGDPTLRVSQHLHLPWHNA